MRNTLGGILFFGAGVLMWLMQVKSFYEWWGSFGLFLGLFVLPLAAFFPVIYWVVTGLFPTFYFLLWGVGLFGVMLMKHKE